MKNLRTSSLTRHFLVGLLTALITLVAAPVSVQAASVTVPPGLAPGSSYRLIFVTSGTRDAQSTNIADYNAFVAAQAAGVPALAALGTTWTAVVSTASPTVAARDNTGTNPASTGVPFYGLNGLRLAANNPDLWDGTFIAPGTPLENAITDSNGNASAAQVWTGTQWEGTGPFGPLGANGAGVGHANSTSNWIANGSFGHNFAELNAMYAMSGVLVVPDYLVTTTGNAIVVTDLSGNGDTLTVSEPSAGNIKFAAAGRLFSINGGAAISGDSGDLSRASVTSITVNAAAGADIINVGTFTGTLPSLTINGGTGNDSVNFSGDITFAPDANLDADLFNDDASPGTDSVVVAASANLITSGTGSITLKATGAVSMAAGASAETANGAISITSTASGISVTGATVTTSGTGNVSITGTGVGDGGGIAIGGGSVISSTGIGLAANQGLLTLNGSGSGFGTGLALTGASSVTSVDGAISITGFGNAGASNRTSKGIVVDASNVQSTGTATINLIGKGNSATFGSDTNAQHHGIQVTGATALITSSAGKITLDGDARFGRSSNNFGVVVQNGAGVTGTGATVVELIGITRIASGLGSNGNGIVVTDAGSRVTTVNGNLTLTGTGADQASSKGVVITTAGQVASTNGTITITGSYVGGGTSTGPGILYDSATAISTSGTINLVSGFGVGARMILSAGSISGTAGVTVKAGAGVAIDLGSTTDAVSGAELSDTELDMITTSGTLSVGDASSGAIIISAPITRSASTSMALTSASNILFNLGTIHTGGGALTLTSGSFGSVKPITSGADVTTSASTAVAFGAGSKLGIAIAGAVEDTDYSPLNVVGKVNLTGITLTLSGAYVPTGGSSGDSFVLVRNDSSDAVTGTFTGLAEGASVVVNGVSKRITYVGGDGNDVALVPLVPIVTSSTITLAANATTITINGFNFDTTPGNNTVVFSNGAVGTVTASSATSLTVTFSTQPTSFGNLTVVVTNGLGSSGAAVQVATVSNIIATLSGGALTITDVANGNDTLSLSESAGNLVVGVNAGSVISSNAGTGSSTNSVSIPLASITGLITVNAAGGTDIINVGAFSIILNGLSLNGGTGNDTVNLNGSITFAVNKNLDVDLQNDDASPGIDNVAVGINARIATSGTGAITVKVSQDINTAAGSNLTTASGDLTLEAAGNITTAGALVADAGNVVVLADSDASGSGVFTSASPVPTLPTGAVLHYTMNEAPATNGVTLTDSSGSGNSSTVFRAAGDGAVAGKFGGALSFPGGTTTEYAIANPVSGAWPTTAFTVSAWVKPSNAGYFFSYAVPGTDNEVLFSANDIWINGNSVPVTTVSPILNDQQFHHVAMTWDSVGGALVVYVDGVQKFAGTITPGSPITGGGSLVLGQDQDSVAGGFSAGQAFGGLMDEVAVFNRALSPAEVATLATTAAIRTGAGSVDLAAVDVVVNAAITSDGGVTVTNTGTASTISGVIRGAGGLTKQGAGTLDLIAANTFAGDTTIDAGTVRLRSLIQNGSFESSALAAGDSVYYNFMTGAQQTAFGWTSTANPPYAAALQANNAAWGYQSAPNGGQAASIQGNSTLSQSVNFPAPGNYTLAWKAAARAGQLQPCDVKLDGITVYSWQTTNNAWIDFSTVISVPTAGAHVITVVGLDPNQNKSVGIDAVTLGTSGSLPGTTAVTLTASGAVLDLNGISQTLGSIAGVSGTSITLGNGNLTTGGDGTSTEFAGVISGAGAVAKAGSGTLDISGANTFTGTTTINAGTLRVNGSLADGLAATDVIVNSTGTLDGSGTINGVTQVSSGGSVAPGAGLGILNTKNVVFSSGSTFSAQIGGATVGTGFDQLNGNGNVTLGGATLSLASFGGFVPSAGESYLIINRTGGTGTFTGLEEGAVIPNFLGSGFGFKISYTGGSGNDVVLSIANTAPTITSNGGGAMATINVAENTTAVTKVVATDSDLPAQTITYSKSGVDAGLFTFTAGGVLTFTAAPDFEGLDGNSYSITVNATDNGTPNLSDSQDLTITVIDVADPITTTSGEHVITTASAPDATGADSGLYFDLLTRGGFIAENGHLAFPGELTGPGVDGTNFKGFWKDDGALLKRLARTGDDAPETGATAAKFSDLPLIPGINDAGQVTLFAALATNPSSTPPTTIDNDTGLWSELGGTGFQILMREGDDIPTQVPPLPAGTKLGAFGFGCFASADTGAGTAQAAFTAKFKGGSTDSALLRANILNDAVTAVDVVARENDAAPGVAGQSFAVLNSTYTSAVRMDAQGNIVFGAALKPSNKTSIWYQPVAGGDPAAAVVAGDVAPGTSSATFAAVDMPVMGGSGTFAFRGVLTPNTGDNTDNSKNDGIWRGTVAGGFSNILRRGDSNTNRPGLFTGAILTANPNIKAGNIWSGWLTNSNHGAWLGWVDLAGNGISAYPADTFGIYTDLSGTMNLLISSGDPAPGIAGATLFFVDHPVVSGTAPTESLAFVATVTGGGTTAGVNDKGIWRSLNGAAPTLVLRTGDSMTVTPGGAKTIDTLDLPGSGDASHTWETPVMDANGRLLVFVTFDDGTTTQVIVP